MALCQALDDTVMGSLSLIPSVGLTVYCGEGSKITQISKEMQSGLETPNRESIRKGTQVARA